MFTFNTLGMMSTSTLLIGYYHGLLMKSIDADLLINKLRSVGILTTHEQNAISSGHSIHNRNQLLLEHVCHMNVQSLEAFCELVQEVWPQVGSQLIIGSYVVNYIYLNCIIIIAVMYGIIASFRCMVDVRCMIELGVVDGWFA